MPKEPSDLSKITRPNWIEINLDALRQNVEFIRSIIPKHTKVFMPVKADAYGHGSLACSYAAVLAGVDYLGVAHMTEGILLRQYGVKAPILVLGPCIPADFPYLAEFGLTASISDEKTALLFDEYLAKSGDSAKAHLQVDTGMHRFGIRSDNFDSIRKILSQKHLEIEGMYTHLATADMPGNPNTSRQIDKFSRLVDVLLASGLRPKICHCSSSAGSLTHPESHFDMVRPGLALYGYNPMGNTPAPWPIKPMMTIKSTVRWLHEVHAGESVSYGQYWTAQQNTKVASVAIGYGDGYLRGEYNKGFVLIRGEICPILGRVCMDAIMVDVSHIPDVQIGETVDVVNGEADFRISMESVADEHHTIPYEISVRVARRLYRKYIWKNRLLRWDDLKTELGFEEFTEHPSFE